MKHLIVVFDDLEWKKLEQQKGKQTWRQFILRIAEEAQRKC